MLILIVNIFLPGVGTMIASLISDEVVCDTFLIGLVQLITAPLLLIGWIWAIIWSVTLIKKTKEEEKLPTVQHQQPQQPQQYSQPPPQSQPHPSPYSPPPQPQPVYSPQPHPSAPPPVPTPPPTKPPHY